MNDVLEQLDRLDDPEPFNPPPELLASARARGRRLRRRRRLGAIAAAVPILLLAAALGAAAYVDHRTDEVHRVTTAAGLLTPVEDGRPFNILLVGTDGPRGQAGVRTDTMMIVHVDRGAKELAVVSIPRDLDWDGTGARIDTVLGEQGPTALISQLEVHLGIQISHYVEIDEPGLAALIDHVGGLRVETTEALRDPHVGLDLPAGCSSLDGAQVVALARSRLLEKHDDATGTWFYDPTSDLGREARQRTLVGLIGRKLLSMPADASTLSTLLDVFADHTTIDAGFSRTELLGLMQWVHEGQGPTLYTIPLPTYPFVAPNGADVLLLDPTRAPWTIQRYLGGTLPNGPTYGPHTGKTGPASGGPDDTITIAAC